jgi:hypothetical protein
MPLPAFTVLGISLVGIVTTGSVSVAAFKYHKDAKKKLKSIPSGILRPPPGMTRSELRQVAQRLQIDITNYYNFALCGGSGTGEFKISNS